MLGRVSGLFLRHHISALAVRRQPLSMISSDWRPVLKGDVPSYSIFARPIEKSPQDDREYRLIRLENGLEATLVHDATADKAAASLSVAVGHLSDPDDMPGLAHFCEHLLFMGTESFPRENDYSEFLAKNNGESNAYTASSNTNYYFNVSTHALAPALARFSAFFHCPLFSPSCTSRELNAVDSENKKNLQNDIWRIFQVNKRLSKAMHPWSKFGTGNRESLTRAGRDLKAKGASNGSTLTPSNNSSLAPTPTSSRSQSPAPSMQSTSSENDPDGGSIGRETRRRLVEWWSKEYCAGRMRLCVLGKESLDDLADLVSALFSPVQNRGQTPLSMVPDHPFGPNEIGTLVAVKTVMAFHAVEISFPIPYQPPLWRYKPAGFIAHFVGHEGPGSLHSYLKQKGWCTTLACGPQALGDGFAMFKNTIHLTNEGFKNYRAVILAMFKYLSLLRASPLPAWYQKEVALIASTRFRFQEKRRPDRYAVWASEVMAWPTPPELTIAGPQLVWEWDKEGEGEKEAREHLNSLRIGKGRVVLMARGEELEKVIQGPWEKEPWYGTEYTVSKFDEDFIKEAEGPNDIKELFLPGPNDFIPANFDVDKREGIQPINRPHLVRETPLLSLWHKKDDRFWVPKAQVIIDIRSPVANASPRAAVLTQLFAELVNDSLTEFAYDADLADLKYYLNSNSLGVCLILDGYNDKLYVLAHHILQRVRTLVVNEDRLKVVKEQLKRDWINFFLEQPFNITSYFARYMLCHGQWTLEEKLKEIQSVTREDTENHVSELLGQVHVRMLVFGNLHKDEALRMAEMTESLLSSTPSPASILHDRALLLPKGSNFIWKAPVPNPNEPNSSLTYILHIGSILDRRTRVLSALLTQIMSEPAFNVLRTKEQLGYIVFCLPWTLPGEGHAGIAFTVQSERGPAYLEERVECFIEGMEDHIKNMEDSAFAEQKAGLEKKWREKWKNLREEASEYWNHLDSGYLDFYRRGEDADFLAGVTQQDILDLFMTHVHPSSPDRAKLSVHMYSQMPRSRQISRAAMSTFEDIAKPAVPEGWEGDLPGQTSVGDFIDAWKGILGETPRGEALLSQIPALTEKFPLEDDDRQARREGATYIENVALFKKRLEISEPPKPVVEWGDLPLSRI